MKATSLASRNITSMPTLADLVSDPTKSTSVPPEAIAALGAAVIYRLLTEPAHKSPPPPDDPGAWVGVGEAAVATGYPRRWFFRHKRMPFCKLLSRKHLLVDLARLGKAIQSGDVRPPQPHPGAASA